MSLDRSGGGGGGTAAAPRVDRVLSYTAIRPEEAFRSVAAFLRHSRTDHRGDSGLEHHHEDLCAVAESLAASEGDRRVIRGLRLRDLGAAIASPTVTLASPLGSSPAATSPLTSGFFSPMSTPGHGSPTVRPRGRPTPGASADKQPPCEPDARADRIHPSPAQDSLVSDPEAAQERKAKKAEKKAKKEAKKKRKREHPETT